MRAAGFLTIYFPSLDTVNKGTQRHDKRSERLSRKSLPYDLDKETYELLESKLRDLQETNDTWVTKGRNGKDVKSPRGVKAAKESFVAKQEKANDTPASPSASSDDDDSESAKRVSFAPLPQSDTAAIVSNEDTGLAFDFSDGSAMCIDVLPATSG